jgi:hypothetical protein
VLIEEVSGSEDSEDSASDAAAEGAGQPLERSAKPKPPTGEETSAPLGVERETPPQLPVPRTAYEYEKGYRALLPFAPTALAGYLIAIPRGKFGVLLKTALEADMLRAIADAMASVVATQPTEVYSVLAAVARVDRFGMALMMASDADRDSLRAVLALLGSGGAVADEEVRALAEKYEV